MPVQKRENKFGTGNLLMYYKQAGADNVQTSETFGRLIGSTEICGLEIIILGSDKSDIWYRRWIGSLCVCMCVCVINVSACRVQQDFSSLLSQINITVSVAKAEAMLRLSKTCWTSYTHYLLGSSHTIIITSARAPTHESSNCFT